MSKLKRKNSYSGYVPDIRPEWKKNRDYSASNLPKIDNTPYYKKHPANSEGQMKLDSFDMIEDLQKYLGKIEVRRNLKI